MLNRKTLFKKLVGCALTAGAFIGMIPVAQASVVQRTGTLTPFVMAGALPDTPAAHEDPNTASSRFSGVVSININYDNQSYICSGALVGKRQVVSAGHCVDTDGNGTTVDLNKPGSSVLVVFNSNGTFNALRSATSVAVHQDYQGFGNCPDGSFGCVNDDVAVITLGADAPASAKIYKVAVNPLLSGTHITMAGYGTSGDGVNGEYVDPDFFVKRTGENYVDLFDGDDEQGFGGKNEVFYADFDGGGYDTGCTVWGVCTPTLPNGRESSTAPGDSGGPSFVEMYGELMLVANNTFGWAPIPGTKDAGFGTLFGGMILGSYTDFLLDATGGNITFVPEPASMALLGMGALMLLSTRRRRKQ